MGTNNVEPRILCLHGYHGTSAILRRQMAGLTHAFALPVELVFADAPSLARGDFGWWHEGFAGWEGSRDALLSQLRDGNFDGIFGFSQGGAMAGMLSAVQQTAESDQLFRFAIMVGGFTSPFAQHARLFRQPITLPSLHIIGRSDGIVPARDSAALAARFAKPEVIEHPSGHVIPTSDRIAAQVGGFISRHADQPEPAQ